MFYLFLGINFVIIFTCVLLLNNTVEKLDQNRQILAHILLEEATIEKMLKNQYNINVDPSAEDILKAIKNTYPHHALEDD